MEAPLGAVVLSLRRHFPGAVALAALAVAGVLAFWLLQDSGGTFPVSFGWRAVLIIACLGLVLGGFAAELTALAAWTVPGDTPIGSSIIALIFALPFYGVMILLLLAAQD
jgi:hypothetical protein